MFGLAALISGVIALPLLPAAALARFPVQKINYDLGEEIGWPSQVKLLAAVWHSLPATERVRATLLAGNYGEAGAVDRYGASFGLPQVYSGANSFWLWGPPPAATRSSVAINVDPALLHREFAHVTQVAVYRNGLNVDDDEEGAVDLRRHRAAHVVGGRLAGLQGLLLAIHGGGCAAGAVLAALVAQPLRGGDRRTRSG